MSAPIIAFFNSAGGVGTTTIAYNLAWMFSDLGLRALAVDLDPQASLTFAFIGRYAFEISGEGAIHTIYDCVEPLIRGQGEPREAELWATAGISLLAGDLRLAAFEQVLAKAWSQSSGAVTSSLWRTLTQAAAGCSADVALLDLGPNLGAINRAALLAADYLVVPSAADRFSLQGLRTLGPAIREWNQEWARNPSSPDRPAGTIKPIGYVVQPGLVSLELSVLGLRRQSIERAFPMNSSDTF